MSDNTRERADNALRALALVTAFMEADDREWGSYKMATDILNGTSFAGNEEALGYITGLVSIINYLNVLIQRVTGVPQAEQLQEMALLIEGWVNE